MRDFQRSRVYRAENALGHRRFVTMDDVSVRECQEFVDRVTRSRYWHAIKASRRVRVMDGRGRQRAGARGNEIMLPRWSRTTGTMLHELAHVGSRDHHGPEFARVFVELVRRFMSEEDAAMLLASYKQHRVKVASQGWHRDRKGTM